MTKQCYALIKTAQENAAAVKELTDIVLGKGGVTKAYNSIKKIAEINDKFYKDFKDTDPSWTPPNYQTQAPAPTVKAPAIAYEEETYR